MTKGKKKHNVVLKGNITVRKGDEASTADFAGMEFPADPTRIAPVVYSYLYLNKPSGKAWFPASIATARIEETVEIIPLGQLINNPDKFDGMLVQTEGYIDLLGFTKVKLRLASKAAASGIEPGTIGVFKKGNIGYPGLPVDFNGSPVRILGVFRDRQIFLQRELPEGIEVMSISRLDEPDQKLLPAGKSSERGSSESNKE